MSIEPRRDLVEEQVRIVVEEGYHSTPDEFRDEALALVPEQFCGGGFNECSRDERDLILDVIDRAAEDIGGGRAKL